MLNIRFNNNKAFMAENRSEYHRLMRDPYYDLIEALTPTMLAIDSRMEVRPYKVLSRIYRDTRFTRDKSPYRDHHWIAFRRAGEPREKAVMFWFELRVDRLSWGLGFWGENRQAMDLLRRRMLAKPDEILGILKPLEKQGLILDGDPFKRMKLPEGLHKDLRKIYPLKELYISRADPEHEWAFGERLLQELIQDYQAMAPMYQLLRGCYDIAQIQGDDL